MFLLVVKKLGKKKKEHYVLTWKADKKINKGLYVKKIKINAYEDYKSGHFVRKIKTKRTSLRLVVCLVTEEV